MQSRHYMLLPVGGHYRSAHRMAWAILDPADYEWAKQFNWQLREDHRTAYARRTVIGTGRKRSMHRELLSLADGEPTQSDHINGDGLDNRRANLRIASATQNGQNRNRVRASASSRFRGVSEHRPGRWTAYGWCDGRHVYLGIFGVEREAAAAARAWREAHMPFSRT